MKQQEKDWEEIKGEEIKGEEIKEEERNKGGGGWLNGYMAPPSTESTVHFKTGFIDFASALEHSDFSCSPSPSTVFKNSISSVLEIAYYKIEILLVWKITSLKMDNRI